MEKVKSFFIDGVEVLRRQSAIMAESFTVRLILKMLSAAVGSISGSCNQTRY